MVVSEVVSESSAALAGIRPGALIKEINRQPVHNMEDFRTAVQQAGPKDSVLLLLKQGIHSRFVVLKLAD